MEGKKVFKIIIALAALCIAVLLLLQLIPTLTAFLGLSEQQQEQNKTQNSVNAGMAGQEQVNELLEFRKAYGNGFFLTGIERQTVEKEMSFAFIELPAPPSDFFEVRNELMVGNFSDAESLEREYFEQPEFVPKFFENGLPYWKREKFDRKGMQGFGILAGEKQVRLKKGEEKQVFVFLHSAWGVETFQGISLAVEGMPEGVKVEIEPVEFLLSPTFPIIKQGWNHKVKIKIRVLESASAGNFVLSFTGKSPSSEKNKEWKEFYGSKYVSGSISGIANQLLSIQVSVE